jgi:Domain of unknown function (DUF2431)
MSCTLSEANAEDSTSHENELVFLTLGDGDLTWSLDLGRFLASSEVFRQHNVRLVASGIDSLESRSQKYRDSNFTIRELKRLNGTSGNRLQVDVCHEVNAIVHQSSLSSSKYKGHFVIFNHPHLGTENAELHGKFLSHLFYSVNKFWLAPSGLFYLTLANGQYDRWKCSDAAERNGMEVVERAVFDSAPLLISNPVYEHRRHQSGKSFASRTLGSETFTFALKSDVENPFLRSIRLPWFCSDLDKNAINSRPEAQFSFVCSFCSKEFSEDRSLRNHIVSVHSQRKRGRSDIINPNVPQSFLCIKCNIHSTGRHFATFEALQDHVRAKHDGIHDTISPDWKTTRIVSAPEPSANYGKCEICQHMFEYPQDETLHLSMFLPSDDGAEVVSFHCSFCMRSFRQRRSKLQHENFCLRQRPATDCNEAASVRVPDKMDKVT